ncbi:deoxyribose-phosphate aldolase [Eubacteriales bacterium OttesenSCG-928-A19]|nr:deoxyribose-phosphate aldolase [Eubacteriales bacterium OttesenSCG-928-A19]
MPNESINLASYIDAAVLAPQLSDEEARAQTQLVIDHACKTVCVRPSSLEMAVKMCEGKTTRASVVLGFPHGDQTTAVKVAEARDTMRLKPFEVDMVNNIGLLRSGRWADYEAEIRAVADVVHEGGARLKVILEISQLTREEIMDATRACIRAGADFVKTSTGFTGGGATEEAVMAMVEAAEGKIEVKASGGIRDANKAMLYLSMGATRLGIGATSVPSILAGSGVGGDGYEGVGKDGY